MNHPKLDAIQEKMTNSLIEMNELVGLDDELKDQFLPLVRLFLLGIIATAIDIVKVDNPAAGLYLYSEIEAAVKDGNYALIDEVQSSGGNSYSVSELAEDDKEGAMNYVGQELGKTLFKAIGELPKSLRDDEITLRGLEALLANLLMGKFGVDAPKILDQFSDHVHMCMTHAMSNKIYH